MFVCLSPGHGPYRGAVEAGCGYGLLPRGPCANGELHQNSYSHLKLYLWLKVEKLYTYLSMVLHYAKS